MEGDHVDEFLTSLGSYDTVLMGTDTYEIGLKAGVTRQSGKDIWLCGGVKLAATLFDAKLIDA